jgi:UDP-N-acetylglucosamine--N-acetylmuramyl-(pentapeptide) pyrophosphoryl-undecaprenol N-acetylglucosamine transferase
MFIRLPKQLEEELKTITVMISGGGTGGHVYPAIAVADELRRDMDIERVIYVGCPDSLEERVAEEHELDFLPIRISGMPRKFSLAFIKWVYRLNRAIVDALGYLIYTKPDVVVGTGGYVSAPVLFAALLLDCPYIIHEADSHPGLVNKVMSPWAAGVSVAFEKATEILDNKNIYVNGNPLRATIGEYSRTEAQILMELDPDKTTMLVLGGSQGAQQINNAVIEALPILLNNFNLQVIHQCGLKNYEEIKNNLPRDIVETPSYMLRGYFEDLAVPLACADFAVSRAGSMSISELAASIVPSILVPYPHAAADHQRNNARCMVEAGASLYIENEDCTGENLIEAIKTLIENDDKLDYMRLACKKIAKKDATRNIVGLVKDVAKPKVKNKTRQSSDN